MRLILAVLLLGCLDLGSSWSLRQVRSVRDKRKVGDPNQKRIVCYYANWAVYRSGDSKFGPDDIHPHLCTHVLYAFATLEKDVGLVPFDPKQDIQLEGYSKFIELKKANPDLQLILSVGGSKEGSARFSKIAADPKLRSQFAQYGRIFLQQFGFDGLDLVWQYPAFTEGSSSSDKENYVQFVKEIRDEFKDDFVLSMVVPSLASLVEKGFNLPELSKYVDFMNVVTYDYHTATEPTVNHVAPLYPIPEDPFKDLNIDATIRTLLSFGVEPSKLNLGIPLYGVYFILEDPEETDIGSSTEDEGDGSQERGAVIYNNFCKRLKDEKWTVKHVNKSAVGPYAYKDKSWVAYDDEDMIKTKASYAFEKKLGGLMFWTIDMDDFKGLCHPRAFPLIKAARDAFLIDSSPTVRPRTQTPPTETVTQPETPKPDPVVPNPPVTPRPSVTRAPPSQTPRPQSPSPREMPSAPSNNNFPDVPDNSFPDIPGNKSFYSNRDIVFQNVKIWISNHYYAPQ